MNIQENLISEEILNRLKKYFYEDPNKVYINGSKQNYEKITGTIKELWEEEWESNFLFMEENRDIYDYLNKIIYPPDPDFHILKSWMKYYTVGHWMGLHIDPGNKRKNGTKREQYTTVILLEQDPDLEGGLTIIAGDSFKQRSEKPGDLSIRDRLIGLKLQNPGDAIILNKNTVHGVTEVKKGHRLVFVCVKGKK